MLVIAIREVGGTVQYDYEVDADGKPVKTPNPPAPTWPINALGVDFFADAVLVPSANRFPMEHLAGLTDLQWLHLSAPSEAAPSSPRLA